MLPVVTICKHKTRKLSFHASLRSKNCENISDGPTFTETTAWISWCLKPTDLIYEPSSWNLDFHWEEIKQADVWSALTLLGPLLSKLHWRHNKDGAIKHEVQQMRCEDNHSPLYSLLKTPRQFANPLSPQPLHSSLCFVCQWGWGQSYGSEWLPLSEALPQVTMLFNEEGTPASINADVLCSLTDVSIFMFFFLCSFILNSFSSWASDVWLSERIGGRYWIYKGKDEGLGVRPKHMALASRSKFTL